MMGLLTILMAACSIREANTNTGPSVHMNGADFVQHTITIHKGEMVNLVDDAPSQHIIQNGTWANGVAKPGTENGAPTVNQTYAGNDSAPIGPFNTAGTFQLYCTIHQNMNLTVTVQ